MQQKRGWLVVLLALGILLSACSGRPTPAESVTALAFDPADGSLLKTDEAGLFRLGSGAQTWQAVSTPMATGLTGIALNPDDSTLYVSGIGAGVLKSSDRGQSWKSVNTGLPTTDVTANLFSV